MPRTATPSRTGRSAGRSTTRRRAGSGRRRPSGWAWTPAKRDATLPGWGELDGTGPAAKKARGGVLERVSTVRFGLALLVIAALFTGYINHVYATQELAAEVQQARKENARLHLKLNRLRGAFDRATGPAVIYERAQALGLEEGIAYGPTITVPE